MMTSSTAEVNKKKKKKTVAGCCSKVGLKRGPWTTEEDELLSGYLKKEGGVAGKWRTLPKRAGLLRCGKSCRLRWMNYLRPSVKRGHISADEEDLILRLHRLLGNRWSLIAGRIPGRTDNEIKNYWNTHLSKKLIRQGIDPRTHKPLNTIDDVDEYCKASSSSSKSCPNPTPNINHLPINNDNDNGQEMLYTNNNSVEDVSYCTDEVFSSFLNSLINEDPFATSTDDDDVTGNVASTPLDIPMIVLSSGAAYNESLPEN